MADEAVVTRERVLGYRVAVQHLERPVGDGVLMGGVQDVPPGRTARVALRVRGVEAAGVLVQSVRGAPHQHREEDLGWFAAALGVLNHKDLAREQFGTVEGDVPGAMRQVAEAMRGVMADGRARTKGELSTCLNEVVDKRLRPWCAGCGVHHVQDALFRYATLQAGLVMVVGADGFRYVGGPRQEQHDPVESQRELVRRFLRLCGPCRAEHAARWLALSTAGARRIWGAIEERLVAVEVDGRQAWVHEEDFEELREAPAATGVWLLPPYDPITELADRELLVPDRARRAVVWRAAANPGVLLVRGEIAGSWRQRGTARRLTVTIETFTQLSTEDREAVARQAEMLTESAERPVSVEFSGD